MKCYAIAAPTVASASRPMASISATRTSAPRPRPRSNRSRSAAITAAVRLTRNSGQLHRKPVRLEGT